MTGCIVERLRAASAAVRAERVSVAELLQAHGPAAHGSLLLLMAVTCLVPIPGAGTVLGLGVTALALTWWQGRTDAVLPRRVVELRMSGSCAQRVLSALATVYEHTARLSKPRCGHLLPAPTSRALALVVAAMGVLLILPIPFGNLLPALALVFIAVGLVFRDGLAWLLGALSAVAATVLTTALVAAAAFWAEAWASSALS